jgi:hypothetical protein
MIGLLSSIGRRTGVARIFGFNFSGFFAWWLWHTIYLSKLPGLDKKLRVAFDWTLDLLFRKDVCAVQHERRRSDCYHHPLETVRKNGQSHEPPTPKQLEQTDIPRITNHDASGIFRAGAQS